MNHIQALFDPLAVTSIGWALVHSTWQLTFVAALYAVGRLALRNHSASLRYVLGCVALGTMVIVVAATVFIIWSNQPQPADVATAAAMPIIEPTSIGHTEPLHGP